MKHQILSNLPRETLSKTIPLRGPDLLEKQMKQMIMPIILRGEGGIFRKVEEEFAISLMFGSIWCCSAE
jgi:hypothetical protein